MQTTHKQLVQLGACSDQADQLFELFGDKTVKVTRALCIKHAADFDFDWAARNLLPTPALVEYEKVRAPAWAEYKKVEAPALAEYEKVEAPAWAEYKKAAAAAFFAATKAA